MTIYIVLTWGILFTNWFWTQDLQKACEPRQGSGLIVRVRAEKVMHCPNPFAVGTVITTFPPSYEQQVQPDPTWEISVDTITCINVQPPAHWEARP